MCLRYRLHEFNQLTSRTGANPGTLTYDANGNQLTDTASGKTQSNEYDVFDSYNSKVAREDCYKYGKKYIEKFKKKSIIKKLKTKSLSQTIFLAHQNSIFNTSTW